MPPPADALALFDALTTHGGSPTLAELVTLTRLDADTAREAMRSLVARRVVHARFEIAPGAQRPEDQRGRKRGSKRRPKP